MGATRESNWSAGTLGAWFCGGGSDCALEGEDIYAQPSPGNRATMQSIASKHLKLVPFLFGLIVSRCSYSSASTSREVGICVSSANATAG